MRKVELMIANINRWVLLAMFAGGQTATGPLQAHAQSLDRIEASAGYVLADALMHYAKRDYARALALLTPLAEQGNAVAQLKLGIIFSRGKSGSSDHVAALAWFTKAAEQGLVDAQFELGRIHRDGLGTRVDGNAAVLWLERAAAKGAPHAFNALGELYLGHQNVPQDFAAARSSFLRGAQLGNSPSMYNLGVIYAHGQGVAQDEIEALKWLALAAETGIGDDRDKALRARSRLSERLTPVEVSWAASRVEDWSRAHLPVSVLASARKP
jgi:TPR repeat protein